jgi:hypothetical protein
MRALFSVEIGVASKSSIRKCEKSSDSSLVKAIADRSTH